MNRFAALLALALFAFASRANAAPASRADVHAVVARVLRAYGAPDSLARVRAYRVEGRVFSSMRHSEAGTVRVFARPDRFKSLIAYEVGPEARIADGPSVWRNEPGGELEPATGPMRDAVLLQAVRSGLPWVLAERESLLSLDTSGAPPEALSDDGKPVRTIALVLPMGGGLTFRAWIDPTGTVRVSQGLLDHGGMQTHFETYYTDFRSVDGVRFAFHEDNWASGVQTGITTVERVIVNPTLRDDEFVPPQAAPHGHGRDHE